MECIFDVNFYLNYIWKFNFKDVVNNVKYIFFVDKFKILFIVIDIIDSGYY